MGIVRQDTGATGTRTSSGGWGTASDGNTWTKQAGTGTSGDVANELQLQSSSASFFETLGASLSGADGEGLVRFTTGSISAGDNAGVLLRFLNNNNYYLARLPGGGNTTQVQLFKKVGGTGTVIANYSHGLTLTNGTFYWIRFNVTGATLSVKLWQDGASEPAGWTGTTTDTSLAGTGGAANLVGLYGFASTATAVKYDSYTCDDLAAPSVSVSDSATGADTYTQTGITLPADTGTGIENQAITVSPFEAGPDTAAGGAESFTIGLPLSADGATGAESVTAGPSAPFPVGPDTAAGAESASLSTIAPTPTDSATGAEALSVSGQGAVVPISDSATGAEALGPLGVLESDSAAGGAETIGLPQLNIPLADSATASDSANLTVALPVTDTSATGAESVGIPTITPAPTDPGGGVENVVLTNTVTLGVTDAGAAAEAIGGLAAPGTGIGDIATSTVAVSWPNSTHGAGSGNETRFTYQDTSNSGWAVGAWPTYGGGPITAIYQITNGVVSANQTSDGTTSSDGHIHWLDDKGGAFSGSEDVLFGNAGDWVEQAPAGTPFRAYWKAIGDTNDTNGFQWTMWVCVYPGDPGLTFYRLDLHNPSASAITLTTPDSLEIALIGGLQQSDATWAAAAGGYGVVGGANHVGWPSTLTTIEPDYVYITPNSTPAGIVLGQETVKKTSLAGLGWSNLQIQFLQSSGSTGRLKIKVQGNFSSFPAGATQTVYLLGVLRRNMSVADAQDIAAAYLFPGTPAVSRGVYTTYSYDEGAYVFAANATAAGPALTATLDLSAANVNRLFKPVIKVTGWTSAGQPQVTWGGLPLSVGLDYRYVIDSVNNALYVQLYYDIVTSGAVSGQKNNAALGITAMVVPDVATGVEAPSLATVTLAVADVAAGLDTPAIALALPVLGDSGAALETLTQFISLGVADAGAGVETPTLAVQAPLLDAATGADTPSLATLLIPLNDAALAAESVTLTASIPASDAATGADSVALAGPITVSVTDTGSGAELQSVVVTLPTQADSATGSEAIAVNGNSSFAITDAATGAETLIFGPITPGLSESGAGGDTVIILAPLAISDGGAAAELVSTLTQVSLSDNATGVETPTTSVSSVQVADTGSGAEALAWGNIVTPLNDAALAADSVLVAINTLTLPVSDHGASNEGLNFLAPIAISVLDAATGAQLQSFLVQPQVTDLALGVDGVFLVSLTDVAVGVDIATLVAIPFMAPLTLVAPSDGHLTLVAPCDGTLTLIF